MPADDPATPSLYAAIINISSVNGRMPAPGYTIYSGAKAAVEAMTIALVRELGPRGVRVNAVAPGTTRGVLTAEMEAGAARRLSSRHHGRPEDDDADGRQQSRRPPKKACALSISVVSACSLLTAEFPDPIRVVSASYPRSVSESDCEAVRREDPNTDGGHAPHLV